MKFRGKTFLLCFLTTFVLASAFGQDKDVDIPFYHVWVNSPHGDFTGEPFAHWNEDGEVPKSCAACHSTTGRLDFLGADGSEAWVVESSAPIEEGVQCVACHNQVAMHLTEVTFPSGKTVVREEADARCMNCHSGRESGNSVRAAIEEAGVPDDQVSSDLHFLNVHYATAAVSRFGAEAGGGFEYDGKSYMEFFYHDDYATQCNDCHSPHSTEVRVQLCTDCHQGVTEFEDIAAIRSTEGDFDGDGDEQEGIKYEIEGLREALFSAITTYATDVAGSSIAYGNGYPYFFNDKNGNGTADGDEMARSNGYSNWTPRLLKAAYNYQVATKDHGAFVHNPQYVIQLLNDSIQDLGEQVSVPSTARPE